MPGQALSDCGILAAALGRILISGEVPAGEFRAVPCEADAGKSGRLRAGAAVGYYPGPYGDVINTVTLTERHVANAVAAVNFDYRGLDTLGEEFILFAAVTGIVLLLRTEESEKASVPGRVTTRPATPCAG